MATPGAGFFFGAQMHTHSRKNAKKKSKRRDFHLHTEVKYWAVSVALYSAAKMCMTRENFYFFSACLYTICIILYLFKLAGSILARRYILYNIIYGHKASFRLKYNYFYYMCVRRYVGAFTVDWDMSQF